MTRARLPEEEHPEIKWVPKPAPWDFETRKQVFISTIAYNTWIPKTPHYKQSQFLLLADVKEVFYGGAAGGGKSVALLMAALQFVTMENYDALIIRKTHKQLTKAGALLDISHQWLSGTGAKWKEEDSKWKFPSGATLEFNYLDSTRDRENYQSAGYNYIAFDELTQFREEDYRFLFSRLRKPEESVIPSRMRSASNPGSVGHCVPFGEVLTPFGWRSIQDVRVGDPVFTVNANRELVESAVEQVHASHHFGDMVTVDASGFSMVCTPKHQVAKLFGQRKGLHTRGGATESFSLVPFEKLPGQVTIMRTVNWKGKHIEGFEVPKIKTRKRKIQQPEIITGDQYASLMGWYLSEGCTVERDKAVSISQMKTVGRRKISALLSECGFKFSTSDKSFTFYAPDWWAYLRQFGLCREKFIPRELLNATPEQMMLLLEALMGGDGMWRRERVSGTYYTISKQLADDVAELAVKLGFIVQNSHRQRVNRRGLSYEVSFRTTKTGGTELLTGQHVYNVPTETKRRNDIQRVPFDGTVYCIGVPDTHTFVLRQNGSVWISGNSWVKKRFDTEHPDRPTKDRVFIPATLDDNPSLNKTDYLESLAMLPERERKQMECGDWGDYAGAWWRPKTWPRWTDLGDAVSLPGGTGRQIFRWCDIPNFVGIDWATSEKKTANWTAFVCGSLMPSPDYRLLIRDVFVAQINLEDCPAYLETFCKKWGPIAVVGEDDTLSKTMILACRRLRAIPEIQMLPIAAKRKLIRWTSGIVQAENDRVLLPMLPDAATDEPEWLQKFIDQLTAVTGNDDPEDDIADAFGVLCRKIDGMRGVSNEDEDIPEMLLPGKLVMP